MDFRNAPTSRNIVDHTNYLVDPVFAGTNPDFINALIHAHFTNAPSEKILRQKYQDQYHNYDPAFYAFMDAMVRKYGKIDDPPEVMKPR